MKLNGVVVAIPLERAALCAQCSGIFSMEQWDRCPWCDEGHFIPLAELIPAVQAANELATEPHVRTPKRTFCENTGRGA